MSSKHLLQSSSPPTQYLSMARMSGISIWTMYLGMAMMSGISISSSITSKQGFSPSPSPSCQLSPFSWVQSLQPSPAIQFSSPHNQMDFRQKSSSVTKTEQSGVGSLQSSPTIQDVCDSLNPQKMLFCHCHFGGKLERSPDGINIYEGGIVEGFGVGDTMDYESFISEVCERLEITDRVGLTIKYTVGNGKRPPSTMRNEGDYKTFLRFNKDEADIFVFKNDLKRPHPESPNANEERRNKRPKIYYRHPSAWS